MTLGLKKAGKHEVRVYARDTDGDDFYNRSYLNVDDVSTTVHGELSIMRLRQGGEFDGTTETLILIAAGFWSTATVKLQEEPISHEQVEK